jgi:hypothetical protein
MAFSQTRHNIYIYIYILNLSRPNCQYNSNFRHCLFNFKTNKAFIYGAGVEPSPLLLPPFIDLLYQPCMIDCDDCGAITGMNECQGKPKYSEEICPNAALSTTDHKWIDWGSNPCRRGGKPATFSTPSLYEVCSVVKLDMTSSLHPIWATP